MSETRQEVITLGDVLRLALPLSATVIAGEDGLKRPVNWVDTLAAGDAWPEQVGREDVVLLPGGVQQQMTQAQLINGIRQLGAVPVAAMVLFAPVGDAAARVARDVELPLILVPERGRLRSVNRDVAALLVDRQIQTTERGMQLYRQLSEMSREGQGLDAMVQVMARLTGKLVIVQDKRLEVVAMDGPASRSQDTPAILETVGRRENLPALLRNRKAAATSPQSHWQQPLPETGMARVVSPIIVGDRARGYLSVVASPDELDLLDSLTVEHGAAACALEMAKAKAVSEAKKELRGNFLESLLAQKLARSEIDRLASRLDHDTDRPHAVLTVMWDPHAPHKPSLRRLETAVNWLLSTAKRPALAHLYGDDHVAIFQSLASHEELAEAHDLARRLQEQVGIEEPQARLVGGLAGPAVTLAEWPQCHRQALQTMQLALRLKIYQAVEFNSLGVYQLLCELEENDAVQTFTDAMIRPLADYDHDHGSSLVGTLDAYFSHHCNISQTAESLFVHRNTLLYRLERIQELTGRKLSQPEMRLAFHLALKWWQLRPDSTL